MARYRSGEDPVSASEFDDILDLLKVQSDWQNYILPNLKTARSSPRSFEVLSISDYRDQTKMSGHVPGITYKQTGNIVMQQWGDGTDKKTYLSAALHECVHLVSDPPQQGVAQSTAATKLGDGFSEGLVEYVTREILRSNHIALSRGSMLGHEDRVKITEKLVDEIGKPLLGKLLFCGEDTQFNMVMEFAYSRSGWLAIKNMAVSNPAHRVIAMMDDLHRQEEERRNRRAVRR